MRTTFVALLMAMLSAPSALGDTAPVRVLVGFPPGGGTDIVARLVADKMKDSMGAPVVIENKPGAGGQVAAKLFKSSAPDGRTLMATAPAPIIVSGFQKLDYDPTTDFESVSLAATFHPVLVVGAATPARTLEEFLAWMKADRSRQSYGAAGVGSGTHLLGALLGRQIGIDWTHVPFNGGPPVLNALAGGQLPAGLVLLSEALALHQAGKVRIIATAGTSRPRLDPKIPTFTELGYPEMVAEGWIAFYAPRSTSRVAINKLSAAIVAAVRSPDVVQRLVEAGYEPLGSTPEAMAERVSRDITKWAAVARSLGLADR
jgi:tripartite-type tricarboxylate transporter receptor subunit TctC